MIVDAVVLQDILALTVRLQTLVLMVLMAILAKMVDQLLEQLAPVVVHAPMAIQVLIVRQLTHVQVDLEVTPVRMEELLQGLLAIVLAYVLLDT
jgi:hypothetical protein